jgi:hypothetical protein
MSDPINANDFHKVILDLETTGLGIHLPPVYYDSTGKRLLMTREQLSKSFSHLDISQIGWINDNSLAYHQSIALNTKSFIKRSNVIEGSVRDMSIKVGNTLIDSRARVVTSSTKQDIANIIFKKGSKGTDRYKREQVDRSRPTTDIFYEIKTADKRRILASRKSLDFMDSHGELFATEFDILKGNTFIAKKLKEKGIYYTGLPQAAFSGKGSNSLYRIIEDLYLSQIRNGGKVEFQGWNAWFDLEVLRGTLQKFGHYDMLAEIDRAYNSGILKVNSLDEIWKAITYKLAQENPKAAENFLIHINPEAIAQTGRAGKVAKSFKDWGHAVPWAAEDVGKFLSYNESVRNAMTEGIELHAAGADTLLEKTIANETTAIYKDFVKAAFEDGNVVINSIEDLVKFESSDPKFFHKILDARIKAETRKVIGAEGVKSAESLFSQIEKTAIKKTAYIRNRTIDQIATTMAKNTKSRMYRFGAISGILTGTMIATYGIWDKESNINPFNAKLSKNMMYGQKKELPKYNIGFENSPSKTREMATLLGIGIGAPVLSLYAIGLHQALVKPKLLGRTVNYPTSIENSVKEFVKTVKFGAKFIESSFPITRVFRASAILDYALGKSSLSSSSIASDATQKVIKFTSYNEGSSKSIKDIRGRGKKFNRAYNESGTFYDAFLDKAKAELESNEYSRLESMFKPTKVANINNKVVVKISNTKHGAIVYAEEFDRSGAIVPNSTFLKENKIKLSFKVDDINLRQRDIRSINSSYRRMLEREGIDSYLVNPLAHHRAQMELVNRKYANKFTEEEYLLSKGIAKSELNTYSPKVLLNRARYFLELDKKSVGEFGNALYPELPLLTRGTKRMILPRDSKRAMSLLSETWSEGTIRGMNTFLESPLSIVGVQPEHLSNIAKNWSKSENITTRILGRGAKWLSRTHLGLTDYDLGRFAFPKYLGKFAAKRILPALALWHGFQLTDHVLGALTFSQGAGPMTSAMVKAYQWSTLAYSKLSDITGLTRISKKQERVAPGSTGLGIFVPALTATSIFKAGDLFYKYGTNNVRESINKFGVKLSNNGFVKKLLEKEAYKGALVRSPLERYFSWSLKNPKQAIFSFMMLPMLPFIPGFIGSSKSYKERKAEYSGRRDVAIRKYRGWVLSSSTYQGGRVTHYRRHFTNLIQSDFENKGVIWPSYFKRAAHNLTGGLYGRYMLEEYHAQDQPVYQSSPLGANMPFVGPIIASTIGRILKPTRTYHEIQEGDSSGLNPYSYSGESIGKEGKGLSDKGVIDALGVVKEGSSARLYHKFSNQFRDLIGFRGFAYETARNAVIGKTSAEEFTPYAQDASEMYNPAQSMWQYQLGDVTLVGGEFLRRLFVYPERLWRVNNIPNELHGVSWIPQTDETNEYKKFGKDLTHGTTFDKVPMGWLYGSRKGWEFLFPEVKGAELEAYPDPVRLEILQSMAPFSNEFNQEAQKVMEMAMNNGLTPYQEQRYYETLEQVKTIKDQVYAHQSEFSYHVSTSKAQGTVSLLNNDGSFNLSQYGDRSFQLAGVSIREEDIRQNLLAKKRYSDIKQLEREAKEIQENALNLVSRYIGPGKDVSMEIANFDQMVDRGSGTEAIIGDLNEQLIDLGAPKANTGNLSMYNMQQEDMGFGGSAMAKYWDFLIPEMSYSATKLIPKKDYLQNYLYTQVFNREVKLWQHPIDQLLKPFIATELHRFLGIDWIPSFTKERRKDQEYWDVLKYVKYKMLSVQASESGDEEAASYYHNLWRATMLGSDPTDENTRDEMTALPQNERAFYSRFANEPDPKKRGKIYKYLPEAAKRIYSATWLKKEANAPNAPSEVVEKFNRLMQSEGWDITDEEYKKYLRETEGNTTLGDYIRGQYVSEYAKSHYIPEADSPIWSPDINIEDIELLTLKEGGRNIEDYGFFENKARIAAFNRPALAAAMDLSTVHSTSAATAGTIIPYLMASDGMSHSFGMPTSSINPIMHTDIQTDEHDSLIRKNAKIIPAVLDDAFLSMSRLI